MKRKAFMTLIGKVYNVKTAEDLAENDLKLSDENKADEAELDDDEVAKVLTSLDGTKVTGLKKTVADATFKKAESQTATRFEKKLRETFEIDDATLQGEDLIDHIKENLPEAGTPGAADVSKLTAEEILKLPAVKTLVQAHKKAVTDLTKQHTDALEAERGKQTENETFSEITKKAEALLSRDGFKVNLPEDADKRNARIARLLHSELKGGDISKWIKKDGEFVPVDKDGVQLEDKNGNPITFDTYVNNVIDTNFDFTKVAKGPEGPSNKNQQNNQQHQQSDKKPYVGRKPTNQSDYLGLLTGSEIDEEQKVALRENFVEHDWN